MRDVDRWLKLLAGLVVALIGAALAVAVSLPLPWTLGPLILVAAARVLSLPVNSSPRLRNVGQWAIGVTLGLYFTPFVLGIIQQNILPIVGGMLFALVLGVFGTYLLLRWGGVDLKTAWFSSAIGGASEMTGLADRYGGRSDLVASAHSLRILTVVLIVPFAFQALGVSGEDLTVNGAKVVEYDGLLLLALLTAASAVIAGFFRIPNGWVLGPMFAAMALTMAGVELSAMPDFVSKVAQLLIGWSLGDRFRPGFFSSAPRFLFTVILFTLIGIVLSLGVGYLLESWASVPLPTVILGLAPGGITEMAITAKVLHLGVPLVTAFHVTRMALVVIVTGPLYIAFVEKHCIEA